MIDVVPMRSGRDRDPALCARSSGEMLVVGTVARIRREFFVKGKSIKEIVRELGVSRNRVRKVVRSGETAFSYERSVHLLLKLGTWAADLGRLVPPA